MMRTTHVPLFLFICALVGLSIASARTRAAYPATVPSTPSTTRPYDIDLPRGDTHDVIELRTGKCLKGRLKDPVLKLETFYGSVQFPAEKVIGVINVGRFRTRQLLVTTDGEVFGGQLKQPSLTVEMASGQLTQVPLAQIARIGYRMRAGEQEQVKPDKPFVLLRSGDRLEIQVPSTPVEVITSYGNLSLDPKSIAYIIFQCEEEDVHEVRLTDGSRFAGLVSAKQLELKLGPSSGREKPVSFPVSGLLRLQFTPKSQDAYDPADGQIDLVNKDSLVGAITGQLKLNTEFDTLTLNAPEISALTRTKTNELDVQIVLWDQSAIPGHLQAQELDFRLKSGLGVKVPVALVDRYIQPSPQLSAPVLAKIRTLVSQLNADEWRQREQAEEQLSSMGAGVAGTLRQLRPGQTPEAQQRIDSILNKIEKDSPTTRPTSMPIEIELQD